MSSPSYQETLSMDPTERQALATAIAEAIAVVPKAPPSLSETAQRLIAIMGGLVGLLGVLIAASGWAFQLQGQLQAVAANVQETKATTAALTEKTDQILADRWTRSEHDAFLQTEIRPLEARIRALETARGR
jgi:hypothetical protein